MCKLSVIISCGPTVQSQVVLRRFLLSFLTLCFWQAHHSEPRPVHSVLQYLLIYILQVSHLFHPKLTHFFFEPKQCFEHLFLFRFIFLNQTLFYKSLQDLFDSNLVIRFACRLFLFAPSLHWTAVSASPSLQSRGMCGQSRPKDTAACFLGPDLVAVLVDISAVSLLITSRHSYHLVCLFILPTREYYYNLSDVLTKLWESYSFIQQSCNMVIISQQQRKLVQHDLGFFVLIYSQHNRLFPL